MGEQFYLVTLSQTLPVLNLITGAIIADSVFWLLKFIWYEKLALDRVCHKTELQTRPAALQGKNVVIWVRTSPAIVGTLK